ncbi:hypothetical protein CPB84DRAFT_522823 [Gymnopilus junonius]|uniref:Uncharacterized protein n=1 Tax=Gymnopilus junonius TaxID=109634 RepID=A0A9P5NY46_GYMJU|nr:hypothetical protein CPB84DRAFT_522823 [Gymnopilus junonius]
MAEAPTLVLAPPTPLRFDIPPSSSSPTTLAHRRFSRQAPARDSRTSDSIYSIYSMYYEDNNRNSKASATWVTVPTGHDRTHSKDTISAPTIKFDLPNDPPLLAVVHHEESDLAYFSPEPDHEIPPAPLPPLTEKPDRSSTGVVGNNGSPRGSLATTSSAGPSSYATPSSLRAQSDLFEDSRIASGSNLRTSDLSASSYTTRSKEITSGSSHSKRSSSRSSHQHRSLRDLPPLPPSTHTTPSPTPPRQPSPSAGFVSPKTSMIFHGKHSTPVGSPSSKVSLVPSEGEDADGFHVRNTYALLEASGVKGDGYEEGVERTRAKIGTSRTSQLQADAALGDGTEKKRNLDEKEIQVLRSVDRYALEVPFLQLTLDYNCFLVMVSSLITRMTG